ncbi:MAG TPA: hypothetical protein V6D00_09245 [Pantanalinema sp.]
MPPRPQKQGGAERDNLTVWSGQSGWHEAYTLKVSDPRQGVALWLRYVLVAPVEGEAFVELWGIAFNGAGTHKHIIIREVRPFEQARFDRRPFAFQIERAVLTHKSARGRIEGDGQRLAWVMHWEGAATSFRPYPLKAFYDSGLIASKVLVPNPDLRISGEVLFNKRRIELNGAVGVQLHSWGPRLPRGSAWAHCATFREDPDASFEAIATDPGGLLQPRLNAFRFCYDGEEHVVNDLRQLLGAKGRYDPNGWYFDVIRGDRRFEGTIEVPYGRTAGLAYQDPSGESAYAYNTQLANMTLAVYRKQGNAWKQERELSAEASCGLEVLTRTPDPEIPLAIQDSVELDG